MRQPGRHHRSGYEEKRLPGGERLLPDSSCANASTSGADERVTAVSAADFAGESFLRKLNADGCFILRSGKYPELEMAADLVGSDPVLTVVLKDSHGSVTGEQSFTARQLSGLSQTGAVGYQYWKKDTENLVAATKYVTLETLLKAAGADFTPGMTVTAADAAGKRLVSGVVTVTVQTCVHDGENQDVPGTPATCTQPGVTAGVKCTDCGVIVSGCTEIPAAGHTPELRDAKDAGCTQDGYTGDTYCSVCGAEDPDYQPEQPTQPENPGVKTGDESYVVLWSAALLLGGAALVLLPRKKRS